MEPQTQVRIAVEQEIHTAFLGVALGDGISLRRAQLADSLPGARRERSVPPASQPEIIDDWSRVALDELERDCIAHLDPLGFRYYIPALMLSLLNHYDPSSMRVIGTLSGLYPKKDAWEYHMHRYSAFNEAQKSSIARFLAELPKLVELDFESQKTVERALRNYWGEYLQPNAPKSD
jgi:hypothetical protein